jgi:hypothetical protein
MESLVHPVLPVNHLGGIRFHCRAIIILPSLQLIQVLLVALAALYMMLAASKGRLRHMVALYMMLAASKGRLRHMVKTSHHRNVQQTIRIK